MYGKILITLDTTDADKTILEHIRPLARMFGSRLVLLHVADGWAAQLHGPDAVSPEVSADKAYLSRLKVELENEGFTVDAELAFGDPAKEIIAWIEEKGCDLLAMSTHGHRFLADWFYGTTAHHVQHKVTVPVLMVRAKS